MMKIKFATLFVVFLCAASALAQSGSSEEYLTWNLKQAEKIGQSTVKEGRSGSSFDFRMMGQDKAYMYQVRATVFTPEVIRASARFAQITNRLSSDETRALVAEAEKAGDLVVMIEIDPAEGSGVVPLDWRVFLQPGGFVPGSDGAVTGVKAPYLRDVKVFRGVAKRDYEYDVFWVIFPLVDKNGKPVFDDSVNSMELSVGIYKKEGKLTWPISPSLRARIKALAGSN
ncbi:MAG TPA: hypothetical protein VHL50_07345 [Pyrinomonadaceae bacterium]|nr:hypothetical protein [Pyrinomonadaceae bacterium]